MTNAADEGRERAAAVDEDMQDFDPLQVTNERDTSVTADPLDDPAQREWEGRDAGGADADVTGTGADPAEIPDEADEVPAADLPGMEQQPESQGEDPAFADLGPEGQGDIEPADR